MKERFEGEHNRDLLIQTLSVQRAIGGNRELASEIAGLANLMDVEAGQVVIEQNDRTTDVYFALTGSFDIVINGRTIKRVHEGHCFGEMAALSPQPRSATVRAAEASVVAMLPGPTLLELGRKYPDIYLSLARDLAKRLLERNALIAAPRTKTKVFVISSTEALAIAQNVEEALKHEDVVVRLWTDGVFKVANYTLEDLEAELDASDFAVAIAHPDDKVEFRDEDWPAPRDNVVFELGYFMGRLGRTRAILMEPQGQKVKLPSDLAGITTIRYALPKNYDLAGAMKPATDRLLAHILENGVFKG
ncbi:cyclic nucleotide-binding protein [Paraburkholderia ginsengiterrae]|uniref:Cyclic nucleotide-binding protein n=1 Tax=Paraburkholderia ginsengiterrae TaxID=1462993 RepID=A0A1A9NCT8_9BURK|nr:TIR domain-containing protein [Paraburkholderia ginsengiterrae]OAJ60780.1 cyclic nucleotide-binding protein [Paraburkholderia ginsengiterrae]OAJ64337.1 cyclic nucleotide-binding protein [Paraburkholderia ginsengiterrae]